MKGEKKNSTKKMKTYSSAIIILQDLNQVLVAGFDINITYIILI